MCSVFILIFLVFHVLEKKMREVSACAYLVSGNGSLYVTLVSYDAESCQEIPRWQTTSLHHQIVYKSLVESVLTFNIVVWYGNLGVKGN